MQTKLQIAALITAEQSVRRAHRYPVQVSKGRLSPLVAFLLQLFFGETKKSFNIVPTLQLIVTAEARPVTLC